MRRAGATLCCGAWASHCGGFSYCRARALGAQASVVVARGLSSRGARALESRLSSCGARAKLLCGMWDLPGPKVQPMSPALAGRFLTTAPPGKPLNSNFLKQDILHIILCLKLRVDFLRGLGNKWTSMSEKKILTSIFSKGCYLRSNLKAQYRETVSLTPLLLV